MAKLPLLALALLLQAAPTDQPGQVVMKKTTSVERDWAIYVPRSYTPRTPVPLVVTSHGRDGRGAGEIKQWTKHAEERGFIVVAADFSVSSGRPGTIEDDEKVVLEMYEYVRKNYAIETSACMITGFSGGGHITYGIGSRHPDKFPFWGGRSANFAPQLVAPAESLKAWGDKVSIYIYYGTKDHEFILNEAPKAHEHFKGIGFTDIKFEQIDGMGHESRAGTCVAWWWEKVEAARQHELLMAPARKAFEAADKHIEKGRLSQAVSELKKAASHMKKHRLGDEADRRIDALADAEIEKASAAQPEEARKILETAKKAFAGTDVARRFDEKLKDLGD